MQDLLKTVHSVPLVPRSTDALQEDGGVSDVFPAEERVPDLFAGSGVRAADTSARHCTSNQGRPPSLRGQQGVLHPEYG